MYRDLHDLLARSDIEAVLIATGPNWHATAACLAANYGKDVNCEGEIGHAAAQPAQFRLRN